ncbi:MAG: AAA family ATPase [candidate division WOR-3 bacterium]|nr:AAA family ATPase [candidate division WOR-3 bacterium]
MSKNFNIEINEEFVQALELMENSDKNVFITGKAGTGKSTLLEYFRHTTRKRIVVLAPTGVAALNVRGETIHSFFRFKPDVTIHTIARLKPKDIKIYKALDAIVIDEISMVRADLLDCVDYFLRLNGRDAHKPFGGTQMIFIGDLYQLPPVVTSKEKKLFSEHYESAYFFDAKVFKNLQVEFIELEKVYRQKDVDFIELLNRIRNNTVTDDDIRVLNSRVGAALEKGEDDFVVHLTTLNEMAYRINNEYLEKLPGKAYQWSADIEGEFDQNSFPTDYILTIKPGAQIMMLNNDPMGRWMNGSIGRVLNVRQSRKAGCDIITVQFQEGNIEYVTPFTWEVFHFYYNEKTKMIESETVGRFTQYPLKLAWAVTIHKSQGKTFNKVIIDVGRGTFAGGQVYVALSRCTSFEGISLVKPIKKRHIFTDKKIVEFLTNFQYKLSEKEIPLQKKIEIIKDAIARSCSLEIVYLKPNDEKSKRIIRPFEIGEYDFQNKRFLGIRAYCDKRKEERTFRIDRILNLKMV